MPRLIVTAGAAQGFERCRRFLARQNQSAATRAASVIKRHLVLLEDNAEIGRPLSNAPELRELIIGFGNSGYLALYRFDREKNAIFLLAFRHQREAGY